MVVRKQSKNADLQPYFLAAILMAAGLAVFWPALQGDWLQNWDDGYIVLWDERLRSLSGLWSIWVPTAGADYWPMTTTFLWLEWHFFGDQTTGYHLCSLGLHILSGFLIWRLFSKLGLRWGWLGGLIFVVHPLTVESVAWISETKNTFSLPFFLLALMAYMDFDEKGKDSDYWKSLGFYLVAMLAKSSVIMLPGVLLLYFWWKRNQITKADFIRMLPFGIIAIALGLVTLSLQNHQALSDAYKPRSPAAIFFIAGEATCFYLGHFLCPYGQNLIYTRWTFDLQNVLQLLTWPSLVALLGLLWLRSKEWGRHALLGAGFYLLTVFPVLGFLNMTYMKVSWVADHFAYLPMIGLIGLLVAGIEYGNERISPLARPWCGVLLAAWLAWSGYQSFDHAGDFQNEEALWPATFQRNPAAWEAHNNLGLIYSDSNRSYRAVEEFQEALKIKPDSAEIHNNLGAVYQSMGETPLAIEQLADAVNLKPDYAGMQSNLGQLLLLEGRFPEAIDHLQIAVKLDPVDAGAQNKLGFALEKSGRAAESVPCFEQALRLQPDLLDAHFNLGNAYIDSGRFSDAIGELETVLRANPNYPGAYATLMRAKELVDQGKAHPVPPPK